jgi:putative cell wall-binding protein
VVEAGHSYHHNPGSMGIAFLGTFTSSPPTSAASSSLVRMLSWASVLHGVDPRRASTYVNPVSGVTRWTQNIAGHRDYNPTACPGVINSLLPGIRQQVAGAIIDRYAGADRYGTAEIISRSRFASGVPVAYVTTGENYPDALAGSVAAGLEGGPVLLVTRNAIPSATARELARLRPAHIVVVGGPAAVSNAVVQGLVPYAPGGVRRIAGADRYATAAAVSAATFAPGVPVA